MVYVIGGIVIGGMANSAECVNVRVEWHMSSDFDVGNFTPGHVLFSFGWPRDMVQQRDQQLAAHRDQSIYRVPGEQ